MRDSLFKSQAVQEDTFHKAPLACIGAGGGRGGVDVVLRALFTGVSNAAGGPELGAEKRKCGRPIDTAFRSWG